MWASVSNGYGGGRSGCAAKSMSPEYLGSFAIALGARDDLILEAIATLRIHRGQEAVPVARDQAA